MDKGRHDNSAKIPSSQISTVACFALKKENPRRIRQFFTSRACWQPHPRNAWWRCKRVQFCRDKTCAAFPSGSNHFPVEKIPLVETHPYWDHSKKRDATGKTYLNIDVFTDLEDLHVSGQMLRSMISESLGEHIPGAPAVSFGVHHLEDINLWIAMERWNRGWDAGAKFSEDLRSIHKSGFPRYADTKNSHRRTHAEGWTTGEPRLFCVHLLSVQTQGYAVHVRWRHCTGQINYSNTTGRWTHLILLP